MFIPSTKEEFLLVMEENCNIASMSINSVPSSVEKRVKGFLASNFGISNLDFPSVYGYSGNYLKYIEDIWDRNESFFDPHIPSGYDPCDRICIMGCKVTQREPMLRWLNQVENSEEWNNGWFTKLPDYERKYLAIVRDFEDYEKCTPDIQLFRISHIPADVKFVGCVPTINELYIAHPHKPGVYLPVSCYEHLLLRERIHEMSKVMMALGATEIRTLQNDASKSCSKGESSSRTSATGSYGTSFSGSGSYASSSEYEGDAEQDSEIVVNFKNDPIKLPYLPENLVWFNHESEWQQIAEARLNGNILEYEIQLSYKQVNLVSDSERRNIEAQARVLLASGSLSRETSSSSIFKEESAKSTRILIRFKSRKDY